MDHATENVISLPIENLKLFPYHLFQVRDDELTHQLIGSVRQVGVLMKSFSVA